MAKGKVGDRIRVVHADFDSSYSNGDVGVIVQAPDTLSGAGIRFDNQQYETSTEGDYLHGHEYELIHETSSATEEAIPWAVGQEVFCLLRGKGVVTEFDSGCKAYPVRVDFESGHIGWYTYEGKEEFNYNRSLFFSDPQIIADKLPPKKPFVPILKRGDTVVVKWVDTTQVLIVHEDTERQLKGSCGEVWDKDPDVHFYKIGEEIKFQ